MKNTENREEKGARLNELKRHIFYELLDLAGRVFVVVRKAEGVVIGKRGFLPEEEEKGLVLVFNSRMNFTWDEHGIDARLVFGTTPEHCIIPAEHVIGVYSPELDTQFLCLTEPRQDEAAEEPTEERRTEAGEAKVVKVDFRRKKT
ncbi:MAG: hypothetical protein GXO94_00500 [Nitrospirae bacterium]|nr:hypothetical protein [Nitrospirota bacterium]